MSDPILTIKDVAEYLKFYERTIYRLAARGALPGFKVGNTWRLIQSLKLLSNIVQCRIFEK